MCPNVRVERAGFNALRSRMATDVDRPAREIDLDEALVTVVTAASPAAQAGGRARCSWSIRSMPVTVGVGASRRATARPTISLIIAW